MFRRVFRQRQQLLFAVPVEGFAALFRFEAALVDVDGRACVPFRLDIQQKQRPGHHHCDPEAEGNGCDWEGDMDGRFGESEAVVKASGIPAAQAIYLGDELRDADAARAAGIAFGAVGWGQHSLEVLDTAQPELCIREVAELAGKLLGNPSARKPVRSPV